MPDHSRVRILTVAFILGIVLAALPAAAATTDRAGTPDLAAIAAADTTPSNVWVAQALIGEVLAEIEANLPDRPTLIVLRPMGAHEATALFQEMAASRFESDGHALYLDDRNIVKDGTKAATVSSDVDLILQFSIESLKLSYTGSGRRFGLWRQWVDRELELVVFVGLIQADGGRMLMDRRIVRAYDDRIPAKRFDAMGSPAYSFTQAEVASSGFRGIFENLVVVGSLAGLIAVYFANSGS